MILQIVLIGFERRHDDGEVKLEISHSEASESCCSRCGDGVCSAARARLSPKLFEDIEELAASCRFRDCAHETEPGCAVRTALDEGQIDAPRLARWRKLKAEDAFNSASLSERREKDRAFGKMVRGVMKQKSRQKR